MIPLIHSTQQRREHWPTPELTHSRIIARIQFSTLNTTLCTTHHLLDPWFPTGEDFAPPGEIWPCPGTLLTFMTWGRGWVVTGIQWVETRDAAEHPIQAQGSPILNYLAKIRMRDPDSKYVFPISNKNVEQQDHRHNSGTKGQRIRGKANQNLASIGYITSLALVTSHASSHLSGLT